MKDSGPWIALLLGVAAIALIVVGQDTVIDTVYVRLNIPTPQATSTLSARNAAAEATRVAQEQYAILTAEAARGEMQATTQAGIIQGTRQAAEANQVRLDQEAIERTEGTAWAIRVTAEYERFVATATSAAEATKEQGTVVARTATRQVEVDDITATAASIQVTVDHEKRATIETEIMLEDSRLRWERFFKKWLPLLFDCALIVWGVVLGLKLSFALLRLFQHKEEKCKEKNMPSSP